MQRLLVSVIALGLVRTNAETATPVQKVIALLTGMLEKGKLNKHEEQVQFASYKQFCQDTASEKQKAIKEADEQVMILNADIQKRSADSVELGKEISEHDADEATWTGDKKASTKVRQIEKTDYDATHKSYSASIDALQRAVAMLKKQAHDRKQAKGAFAQVGALKNLDLIPKEAKRAIELFLSQADASEDLEAAAAPDANGYEFQSHGIVDMLSKLTEKFVDERSELEKGEMNAAHAYDMLMQDLTAQIDQAKTARGTAATNKAKALQDKADSSGSLQDTSSTRKVDSKYLSDLTAECTTKAGDFEERQELRGEELQTLEKAIEIIGGKSVGGAADKHLPALLSLSTRVSSFAALRSADASQNINQERAAQFLRDEARHINSHILSTLSLKVREDPFKKVAKMIKDLIVRLMEEANEEAEHKGFCDSELAQNAQTRKEKTEQVETLHAEIDETQANMAQLGEDINSLSKQLADLAGAMADATKLRVSEKDENLATIRDAQDAQTAVAQALLVLKEFYAKSAEATALVQKRPSVFSAPYTGMGADSGGVIGMIEVIQSDFARLESSTKAAEQSAQKSYDEFMTESKVDKASKNKDSEHKSSRKQDAAQSLATKSSNLEGTQKELDAALSYYDKLKPSCVDAGSKYDDRVGRRKEEIQSLQEALKILNGEDI